MSTNSEQWYEAGARISFQLGLALLCVIAAIAVRAIFGWFGGTLYFSTFYPAVLVASLLGGFACGVLTTVFAATYALWAYSSPNYDFGPLDLRTVANLTMFGISGLAIAWISDRFAKTRSDLKIAMRELQHRGKNSFATVQSIVSSSLSSQPETARTIIDRIRIITSADDLLGKNILVELSDLVSSKVSSFAGVFVQGPPVQLSQNTARNLSLVLHELCTNAVKYGSLSSPLGKLFIKWTLTGSQLQLDWCERDGPIVTAPERTGFGSRLITALTQSLGGSANVDFKPEGIAVKITIPLTSEAAVHSERQRPGLFKLTKT